MERTGWRPPLRKGRTVKITHAASPGERLTSSATVLLLDTSNFVFTRGSFPAVREAALALSALIRERFPQDTLALIAFSYLAREIEPAELPLLAWDNSYGNNVQHGLTLARQILTSSAARKKYIFLVSEGQVPTAHMENGQYIFNYPPTHACITTTLAEVEATTRESIALYTFLLRHSGDLDSFVDHLSSIKNSYVLYASPESLTETILTQYVRSKG